jgi:hypothetical protein
MKNISLFLSKKNTLLLLLCLSVINPSFAAQATGALSVIPITEQDRDVQTSTKQANNNNNAYGYEDDYFNLNTQNNKPSTSNEVYDYNAFNNLIISLKPSNPRTALIAKPTNVIITLTNAGFDKAFYLAAQGTVITFNNKSNKTIRFQAYNEDQQQSLKWKAIPSGNIDHWTVSKTGDWQLFVDRLPQAESQLHFVSGRQTAQSRSNQAITFTDLPIGSYQISGWHEVLPAEEKMLQIYANKTQTITLHFSPDAR